MVLPRPRTLPNYAAEADPCDLRPPPSWPSSSSPRPTAQPAAHLAEVTAESVAVRSGPSDQMPETGTVFRGTRVVVDHEEGEHWVAIQPPRGQVSWIKHLFLKPAGPQTDGMAYNAVVTSEGEVEVAAGRPGFDKPLDVRKTRVPDQTIVLVIGKKVEHAGSVWYPIEPPDGDFRYVPKSAVRRLNQTAPGFVVNDKPKAVPPETKPAFEPVAASIPGGGERRRTAGGLAQPPPLAAGRAGRAARRPRPRRDAVPAAGGRDEPARRRRGAGEPVLRPRPRRPREAARHAAAPTPGRRDLPPTAGQWVGPGMLRRTGLPPMNGRMVYSLDGPQGGRPKCYAVAGSGVDLERFKGYDVQLYGEMTYPGDLRGVGLLTVTRVQTAR